MEKTNHSRTVLVTGGSGFIAVHCITRLLNEGYTVRATLRSLDRSAEVIDMLKRCGITTFDDLSFVKTDLSTEADWATAAANCTYVLHIPSPTPGSGQNFIAPAVNGVLYVLKQRVMPVWKESYLPPHLVQ